VATLFVPRGAAYKTEDHKLQTEERNLVIQARFVAHVLSTRGFPQGLTPDLIRDIQQKAITQIYHCAGHFRDGPVTVEDGKGNIVHIPPPAPEVPRLVADMCDFIADKWGSMTAIDLGAYAMWRVNWIHPFFGGNGRTAREVSYLVLCARLGFEVPGVKTIPELITENRDKYNSALRKSDAAFAEGTLDFSSMAELLDTLLAQQLISIHALATGEPEDSYN
jgi:Fic family protein